MQKAMGPFDKLREGCEGHRKTQKKAERQKEIILLNRGEILPYRFAARQNDMTWGMFLNLLNF
jgi:hypothetical protein